MLEVGQEYAFRGRRMRVLDHVKDGSVARVFKVGLMQSFGIPETIRAAKVALRPDLQKYLRQEHDAIQSILEYYRAEQRPPVPNYVEFDNATDGDHDIPVLLMEYINAPELYDVYQNHIRDLPPDDLSRRLEAERLAWYSARQYLDLLRTLLFKVRIISADRKRDAFRWQQATDSSRLHDGRLIVIDWNAIESLPRTPDLTTVLQTLRLFSQNWYVMLTQQQPGVQSNFYADETWRYVTLAMRRFLLDLLHPPATVMSGTPESVFDSAAGRVQEVIDLLYESSSRLRYAMANTTDQHNSEERLILADIARRIPSDLTSAAQAEYTRLIERQKLSSGSEPISVWRLESLSQNAVWEHHKKLLNEIQDFLRENSQVVERYRLGVNLNALIKTIDQLQSAPANDAQAEFFAKQVGELRHHMENAFGTNVVDTRFTEMLRLHYLYRLVARVNEQLKGAREKLDDSLILKARDSLLQLEEKTQDAAYATALELLGVNADAVKKLRLQVDDITKTLRNHLVYRIRERFVEACRQGQYADLRIEIEQALLSPLTNQPASDVLIAYLDVLDQAEKFAYVTPITDSGQRALLADLVTFVDEFPGLRDWARELPFVESAKQRYRRLKRPIMRAIHKVSSDNQPQSVSPIDMQRALQLARLLRDLFTIG